ncbi:hypothetical protein ONS95_001495 [Cadophora gregata]|uniref:uncharacterized protein n=1 Tax=Cadophora gregata TaxID=51156 RepID=UPI0026DB844B|nr:uncharacterized protein ONS95_001495 [Cadophora gregata]KAK0111119.1 hypothetical protein ONS95_001495 [Cadophora gregata]KAK0112413.1 hypothetical protein ONS96_001657 [Cadophora gregata f. sp. sojae]
MSSKNFMSVIPWDPTSEQHFQRLQQQRISCGWGVENVSDWGTEQLEGKRVLCWLVIKPTHPCYDTLMASHISQFPQESECLPDSGSDTFPVQRERKETFMPIGHISLDFPPTGFADPARGRIGATSLYLSPAIRGLEFGRHVFGLMRGVAGRFARYAVMEVPIRETVEAVERFEKFGDGRPEFSLADWYESIGCKRLHGKKRFVNETDSKGRVWNVELVGMEWDLWGSEVAEKPRL